MSQDKDDFESLSGVSTPSSYASSFRNTQFYTKARRDALKHLLKNKGTTNRIIENYDQTPKDTREKSVTTASTALTLETDETEESEIDDPPKCYRNLPQHLDDTSPEQTNEGVKYYRVVYHGIIALVSEANSKSKKSGAYLSYGDIFESRYQLDVEEIESQQYQGSNEMQALEEKTNSPPRNVLSNEESEVSSLNTIPTDSSAGGQKYNYYNDTQILQKQQDEVRKEAIRVDRILTGGYAMDGKEIENTTISTKQEVPGTPKRSNAFSLSVSPLPFDDSTKENNSESFKDQKSYGFLMSPQKDIIIVECIPQLPRIRAGNFLYQITSGKPVTIFTSPCWDAPTTKAALLPGSIHKVCIQLHDEEENVNFLRLSHRRGWICETRVFLSENGNNTKGSMLVAKQLDPEQCFMHSSRKRYRPPRRKREIQKGISPNTSGLLSPNLSILSDDDELAISPVRIKSYNNLKASGSSVTSDENLITQSLFLYKVNAPRGLKILDAPHFQVSTLIRGGAGVRSMKNSATSIPSKLNPKVRSAASESTFSTLGKSYSGKTINRTGGNPAIYDSVKKQRILPRGAIFEASRRIEKSAPMIQGGAGLIKLSDNSGWAIIPGQEELDFQYRHFNASVSTSNREAALAVEEVGNAIIQAGTNSKEEDQLDCIWVRSISRNIVKVECVPPPEPVLLNEKPSGHMSPQSSVANSFSSAGGSNFGPLTNHDSDVTSTVGNAFLDAMFQTPKRGSNSNHNDSSSHLRRSNKKPPQPYQAAGPPAISVDTIHCGMYFQINKWDDSDPAPSVKQFVRIRGGQGWIPRILVGKPVIERIPPPDVSFGSFWFRVSACRGIKVRRGPSRRSSSIKSDDGVHFLFETGEFLRASEVVTFFSEMSSPETFAKLYRNRHAQLNQSKTEHRSLEAIAASAEWVQISMGNNLFLEKCKIDPEIQRSRSGWKYNVVCENCIKIRRGPSFAAETTGKQLVSGDLVLISERVMPPDEQITWLKLKDGRGWVHDNGENDEPIILPQTVHDRKKIIYAPIKTERTKKDESTYNTLIARLFPSSDEDDRRDHKIN